MPQCTRCNKMVKESEYWKFPYDVCIVCIRGGIKEVLKIEDRAIRKATKKEIKCLDCGINVIAYSNNIKRCKVCALKSNNNHKLNYAKKKRLAKQL